MKLQHILLTCASILFSAPLLAEEFKIGENIVGDYLSQNIKAGTLFNWILYIPETYDPNQPAALYVSHDGLINEHAKVLEKLAKTGEVPTTICIGLTSGRLQPSLEGGTPRSMRAEEYDEVGIEYADFLVDEFIPWLVSRYNLNIDPNPDRHLIYGCSSGGISAWSIAWFRNDYFRLCYMSSPTFSSFRGGEQPMFLARIAETRPIRVFEIYGEHEPNFYSGDSFIAAKLGENSFEYAGYPFKSEYIQGGGHGAGATDLDVTERGMKFLWENWKTEPVKPLRNQPRLDLLVEFGTAWEETDEAFPDPVPASTRFGTYKSENGKITFLSRDGNKRIVSESFGEISGLAVSTDGWRLYVADRNRRFIFAVTILPDGSLGKIYRHSPLRLAHDVQSVGAYGICLDTEDRVYAATDLGIQGIVPFGIVDSLLPLPGDKPAEAVAFGGEDRKTLYARSGNKTYKRPMKTTGKPVDFPITSPNTIRY